MRTAARRSSVPLPPALALLFAEPLLRVEPGLLGRTTRFRGPPLLRYDERRSHQVRQPTLRGLPVLTLASAITRDYADVPLAVEPGRKFVQHALALLVREGPRRADVPEQLNACGRRVHVLAASAA